MQADEAEQVATEQRVTDHPNPADDPAAATIHKKPDAESTLGLFSRSLLRWALSVELNDKLDEQFERYDIDDSGWIDNEPELNLLGPLSFWMMCLMGGVLQQAMWRMLHSVNPSSCRCGDQPSAMWLKAPPAGRQPRD